MIKFFKFTLPVKLFLLLILLQGSLLSEGKQIFWKNFIVSKSAKGENNFDRVTTITFKLKKTKKVFFTDVFDHGNYQIDGFYRTKEDEFLHLSGYSGGESGCCSINKFYYLEKGKVSAIEIEELAYSPFKIVDMDGDRSEEFLTYNDIFYGIIIMDETTTYTLKTEIDWSKCQIRTERLYVGGFSDPVFPKYRIIQKDKNKFQISDVTFQKKYRNALRPYILKAEAYLEKNKNNRIGEDLKGILQYFYYMHKINKESEALEKIKSSGMKVDFERSENDVCKKNLPVYELIQSKKEKILSIEENPEH